MIKFIKDFFIYPWDKKRETNTFHQFLSMFLKDYPAFLWEKPSIWRVLLFPFLFIYILFGGKREIKKPEDKQEK